MEDMTKNNIKRIIIYLNECAKQNIDLAPEEYIEISKYLVSFLERQKMPTPPKLEFEQQSLGGAILPSTPNETKPKIDNQNPPERTGDSGLVSRWLELPRRTRIIIVVAVILIILHFYLSSQGEGGLFVWLKEKF